MSKLIEPNKMAVETTYAAGPLAQPLMLTLNSPAGPKVLALGGLTKVEQLAGLMYAANGPDWWTDPGTGEMVDKGIARAVDHAERLLAECERRTKERQVSP